MFILLLSGSAQSWINTVNIVSGCQLFAQPLQVTGRSYEPITQGACTDHQWVPVPRDMDALAQPGPSGGCANSWHPLEMLTENYHCILLIGPILIEARWTMNILGSRVFPDMYDSSAPFFFCTLNYVRQPHLSRVTINSEGLLCISHPWGSSWFVAATLEKSLYNFIMTLLSLVG